MTKSDKHEAEVSMALRACLYIFNDKGPYSEGYVEMLAEQIEKLLKERATNVDA